MKSVYLQLLEAECAKQRRNDYRAKTSHDHGKRLRDDIAQWHGLLPVELRERAYTMAELVREFGTSPMAIGTALAELGWIRKRNWRGSGPFVRFWFPPICAPRGF